MKESRQTYLISRTDNIGDVVLTLPLAALLKQQDPHCKIFFLARNYVKPIIEACPHVDQFVNWDYLHTQPEARATFILHNIKAHAVLHVFPNKKIAQLCNQACIPNRIGTSRRWYHRFYCNRRVCFSRRKSTLHEAQLNLQLLAPLGINPKRSLAEIMPLIQLIPKVPFSDKLKALLKPNCFNLIIHPLSNGNSKEWPLAHYRELIQSLAPEKFNIIISGTAREGEHLAKPLLEPCPHIIDTTGKVDLRELLALMPHCDGLLVGSTGPLHMGAALGLRTLGLFPPLPGSSPQRWGPIGKRAQTLMCDHPCKRCVIQNQCACMQALSTTQVHTVLEYWYQQWKEQI